VAAADQRKDGSTWEQKGEGVSGTREEQHGQRADDRERPPERYPELAGHRKLHD